MQYQCCKCNKYVTEGNIYKPISSTSSLTSGEASSKESRRNVTTGKTIDMPTCYCEPCYRALGHNQENNFQAEYVHCLDAECDDLNTRNNINIAVFENRQNFLSVCQSNHYQFDQVCCVFPRLWNS